MGFADVGGDTSFEGLRWAKMRRPRWVSLRGKCEGGDGVGVARGKTDGDVTSKCKDPPFCSMVMIS